MRNAEGAFETSRQAKDKERSRASTPCGGESPSASSCRRSRNSVSASFPSALWARASSRARSAGGRRSTGPDFRNIVPRFTPEAPKANQPLVDPLGQIATRNRRRLPRSRSPAVRSEAVDRPDPGHYEAASPGREHQSGWRRTDAGRSPRDRQRSLQGHGARGSLPEHLERMTGR